MDYRATAIPMVGGSRLDKPQPQKEEPKTRRWHTIYGRDEFIQLRAEKRISMLLVIIYFDSSGK